MKRLYYLTRTLSSVIQINQDLQQAGIPDSRLHVFGHDEAEMERAQIHPTTFIEDTDIMHSGFTGALTGLALGMVAGFLLAAADPFGTSLGTEIFIAVSLFGTCFGAWVGGLKGISSRNHHLAPYLEKVEQDGDYLLMVDADDERQLQQVESLMSERHAEAQEAGKEQHYSPFF